PAWNLPALQDVVRAGADDGRIAGAVVELCWNGRPLEELVECGRHECLINAAFAGTTGFAMLCPYDVRELDPWTVDAARTHHPFVRRGAATVVNGEFVRAVPTLLDTALTPQPDGALLRTVDADSLGAVRRWVAEVAAKAGLDRDRTEDLVLALSEAASNSI